jgi:hypothetical protein
MSSAQDTPPERIAEYRRLFDEAMAGKERTATGIRFRFHARPGVEVRVRDLAAREKACCPFFGFDVTAEGDEVLWDAAVTDNDAARAVLEEFYALPDTVGEGVDGLRERFAERGLEFPADPTG